MSLAEWIEELQDMLKRRRGSVMAVALTGSLLAFLFAASMVHQYRSVAVLQVQEAMVADELSPSNVSSAKARHLQVVEQQIMAHGAILQTAEQLGLLDDLGGLTEAEKVAELRSRVRVEGVAAASEGPVEDGSISLVRISADWGTRQAAQALAQRITEQSVEVSNQRRLDRARETLAFFTLREEQLKSHVADGEEEIALFRQAHGIPEDGAPAGREREAEALKAEILAADREIITVQSQLERIAGKSDLTTKERQQRTGVQQNLSDLIKQRDYLVASLEQVSNSAQRDPEALFQLAKLERELTALKDELRDITNSRKAAEVAFQLESQGYSEHLVVLEAASWPDYPFTPSRAKTAVLGAVASLLAGLAWAFLLDLKRPVLRSAALMQRDLGYAPVATIPQATPERRGPALRRAFGRGKRKPV